MHNPCVVLVLVLSNRLSCRLSKAPRLQCQICKLLWVLNYRSFSAGVTFQRSICCCARDVAPVGRACRTCPRDVAPVGRASRTCPRDVEPVSRACRTCPRDTTAAAAETAAGQQRSTAQQPQVDSSAGGDAWLTPRGGGAWWRSGRARWRSGSGLERRGVVVEVRSGSSHVAWSCTELNCRNMDQLYIENCT